MTRLFSLIVSAALLLAGPLAAQDAERYGTQRVAYHINKNGEDGNRYYFAAMRNVQNHINALGAENLEVAVVMHGNGLGLVAEALDDTQLQSVIASLKAQGVDFLVCANTLRGREISYETDLYDVWEEDIVPSGVAELSHLQAQGYTYIRP